MIGNREDAEFIGEWEHESSLPNGWHYLGEGSQRTAYLSPDGVVYKVELPRASGSNECEYANIERLKEIPLTGWDVPNAELYVLGLCKTVIAMEFVVGEFDVECPSWKDTDYRCDCGKFPCTGIEWEVMEDIWGIEDITYENVIVRPDGTRVLIDVAR